jgi:hypothetical protein
MCKQYFTTFDGDKIKVNIKFNSINTLLYNLFVK